VNAALPAVIETDALTADEITATAAPLAQGSLRALARAASGSFALSIVNTAAAVLTTVLLARVMELAAFGVYSWVMATVTLLTVTAVLGVDRLLVRDIAVYIGRGAYGHVRGLLRRTGQLVTATCLLIAAGVILAVWLAGAAAAPTVVALAVGMLALPLLAYGRVSQSALMGIHRVVVAQVPDLLVRPLSLLLAAGAVFLVGARLDAVQAVGLYTASTALSLACAAILLRRHMRTVLLRARPAYETRRWLGAAFALVLLSGGLLVNSQTGVVLLGLLDGPESAGLYAVAQRGALLVAFPLMALGAALAPRAARLWAANQVGQLQRLVTLGARAVLLASVPIALVFVVAGEGVLGFVFGASFAVAGPALAVLSVGQIVNAATGSVATLLIMTGNTWRASLGMAAGVALNLVLAVLLIPAHHGVGAAAAAAASLVVANVIHVVMARRALGIDSTAMGMAPHSPMTARPHP
jgi:O-antigen/teichoic acid export membrane protein